MSEESNITMPPEVINNRRQILEIRMEKKMTTSTTIEFEKHPYKERLNGVVGKNQPRNE